jgi:uncharacterized membrane protein
MDCINLGTSFALHQMGIISVDRYIYIAHPFYYMKHVTKRLVFRIIACLWCVGIVYGLVPLIAYRDSSYHINVFGDIHRRNITGHFFQLAVLV